MAIETIQDLNAQACCCDLLLCPKPVIACQIRSASNSGTYILPFADPAAGEIPNLYASSSEVFNEYYSGTIWTYSAGIGGYQVEYLQVAVFSEDPGNDGSAYSETESANEYDEGEMTCGSYSIASIPDPDPSTLTYIPVSAGWTCTEVESKYEEVETAASGAPLELHGCPGPFNEGEDSIDLESYDIDRISYERRNLSSPLTKATAISTTIAAITGGWTTVESCQSTTALTHGISQVGSGWPTRESVIEILNPSLDAWFVCGTGIVTIPVWCYVTTWRFRFVIPSTWTDPVTGATVTFPGTYFLITYDIVEEPDGWDDTIDDPDYEPPEEEPEEGWPPVPQIPRPDRPARTFYLENQTAEWTGPGVFADATSWIVGYSIDEGWITVPPPTVPGRRYLANIRFVCRESWFIGELPQVMGTAVDLS